MSNPTEGSHPPHGSDSGDAVDYGKVVGVGVGSLVIFAISIWWSTTILRSATVDAEARAGKAKLFDTTRTEIGMVDQVPFSLDQRLPKWRAARRIELERYSWIDKQKGIVRIPIEQAMDRVVGGAMPAGAPK